MINRYETFGVTPKSYAAAFVVAYSLMLVMNGIEYNI
jgi:hypothetical protein